MFDSDMFLKLAAGEVETPSLFPYPMSFHIVFVVIAVLFFGYRFFTEKKPFQLIFAIAVPISLIIHIFPDNRTWFYFVGAAEVVLILAALVSCFIFREKKPDKADEAEASSSEKQA